MGRWYSDTGSVSECTGYSSGHRKGFRAPPASVWALWAKGGGRPAHKGAGRPFPWLVGPMGKERGRVAPPAFPSLGEKGKGGHLLLPSSCTPNKEGGGATWGKTPSRIR